MVWKASQSVRVCHGGAIAGLNECTNGCMSVVLRSCFSYQVAAGSTTSEKIVVLVIRKSSVSSRSSLPSGASSRQTHVRRARLSAAPRSARSERVGAEQVLEEVLVALAGGAEQVGPPDRSAPAGSSPGASGSSPAKPQLAGLELRRRRTRPTGLPGGRGLVGEVERVAVERRVRRHPAHPRATARCTSAVRLARRTARWPVRGGQRVGAERGRSGTGRCAGTSTRSGSCCRGGRVPVQRDGELGVAGDRAAPSPGRRSAPSRRR